MELSLPGCIVADLSGAGNWFQIIRSDKTFLGLFEARRLALKKPKGAIGMMFGEIPDADGENPNQVVVAFGGSALGFDRGPGNIITMLSGRAARSGNWGATARVAPCRLDVMRFWLRFAA